MAAALGLPGVLPEGRPGDPNDDDGWFLTDWMDTARAQEALAFQQHSWPAMLAEMSDANGVEACFRCDWSHPSARVFLARRAAYRNAPGTYADVWGAVARQAGRSLPGHPAADWLAGTQLVVAGLRVVVPAAGGLRSTVHMDRLSR